jgi:protein-S-isoprenylcysteine O-methyltransferase Ste14
VTNQEIFILVLLFLGGFIIPIIYAATNWLDFANYTLPAWAAWLGVLILAAGLFIFWRAHADLGLNWSPSLEIREKHELITRGIYGVIRHPMYASQWLWVIAQPLLLQNWIAGFLNLFIFIPFYFLRVKAEEQMMLDSFGTQYREYMQRTGGVLPKM